MRLTIRQLVLPTHLFLWCYSEAMLPKRSGVKRLGLAEPKRRHFHFFHSGPSSIVVLQSQGPITGGSSSWPLTTSQWCALRRGHTPFFTPTRRVPLLGRRQPNSLTTSRATWTSSPTINNHDKSPYGLQMAVQINVHSVRGPGLAFQVVGARPPTRSPYRSI